MASLFSWNGKMCCFSPRVTEPPSAAASRSRRSRASPRRARRAGSAGSRWCSRGCAGRGSARSAPTRRCGRCTRAARRHERRVEAVDPLDDDDVVAGRADGRAALALPGHERRSAAARPSCPSISASRCSLKSATSTRLQALVVGLPARVPRRPVPVDEIVVQPDRERPASVRQELHGEALGRTSSCRTTTARRRTPGRPACGVDAMSAAICAIRASCSASATSEISGSRPGGDRVVQRARAANAEAVEPVSRLFEHREQLRVRRDRRHFRRPALVGKLEHESGRKRMQREIAKAARRRHHVPLEVVLPLPQAVHREHRLLTVREEADLVFLAPGLEDRHGLRERNLGLVNPARRLPRFRASAPRCAEGPACVKGWPAPHLAVVAPDGRRRVFDADGGLWKHFGGRGNEQEREGPAVDATPVRVRRRDGPDVRVRDERRGQLAQSAADERSHVRRRVARGALRGRRGPPFLGPGGAHDRTDFRADRRLEDPAIGKAAVHRVPRGRAPDDVLLDHA